ncbi:MAG: DUF1207 domain-containing protein [Bacteroidota bacterium]|nr:DUF1207 domain-containing protein [Bacteroidota bacterium]
MKYKLLLSILFSVTSVLLPQEVDCKYHSIQWFPGHLNIQPFTANVLEARSGFVFFTNKSNLQLNAGSSQDVFNYKNKNDEFSFGADIFTFTRLRSTKEFKFPVETIDYLFGINLGYKTIRSNWEKGIRFRLSHISTHQVDGDYDSSLALNWRNNRVPIVYSREFIEIIPYVKYEDLRLYAGFTYLFHVLPSNINKYIYQTGFDYYYVNCKLPFSPFAAYDLKIEKREVKYTGNNNISTGIKFGSPSGKGFSIYYSYVSGYSVHGQLYNEKEKYSAIGINLDL